jgi:hypothetical protein
MNTLVIDFMRYGLVLQDIPGKRGIASAGEPWRIIALKPDVTPRFDNGAVRPEVFFIDNQQDTLCEGIANTKGHLGIPEAEQESLFMMCKAYSGKTWLISGLTAIELVITEDSTSPPVEEDHHQYPWRIVDALNFSAGDVFCGPTSQQFLEQIVLDDTQVTDICQCHSETQYQGEE